MGFTYSMVVFAEEHGKVFGHKMCLHKKSVTLVRGGGAEVNDVYGAILTRVWGIYDGYFRVFLFFKL